MLNKKSFIKGLTAFAMAAILTASSLMPTKLVKAESTDNMRQLNNKEITAEMGAGWNLGNTMEAFSDYGPNEEMWGNPKVTPELFKAVKAAGFNTVRIPITLLSAIGPAPDYKIDPAWFGRVKEVIDYAYDAGLYVIVDGVHGDGYTTIKGAFLLVTGEDQEIIKDEYQKIWLQYAEMFKDYDEHIIFESMNEVFDGTFYDPDPDLYKYVNDYNQVFVDTIRKTGGNNASRWLLVPGWNTNIDHETMDFGFVMPTDTYRDASIPSDEQRLMISAHDYDPYDFTLNMDSNITQWGKVATDPSKVANWGQEDFMEGQFVKLYQSFVQNGYPVVIGEYCATDKTNKDPDNEASRVYYCKMMNQNCKKYGAVPCYWDIGVTGPGASGIINRKTCEVVYPDILNAIMEGYNSDVKAPATFAPSPTMEVTGPSANVKVLYKCGTTDALSSSIRFNVSIQNDDTVPVDLSNVKLRYWYTRDDGKWQSFNCYYAVVGSQNIYGNMVRIPLHSAFEKSDFYAEIGLGAKAGILKPGQNSGEMQITITKYDNSNYNQANDYSYDPSMTNFTENGCITAYVNGNLAFGTEPSGKSAEVIVRPTETVEPTETTVPTETVEPTETTVPTGDIEVVIPSVSLTAQTGSSNNLTCSISSVGSKPVDLSKLAIRYYFDKTGNKAQNFWCDNAGLQLNVSPYYLNMTSDVKGTFHDGYLEITFDSDETIPTGAGSLDIGMRFAQEDWSAYTGFVDNGYAVYYNGVKLAK